MAMALEQASALELNDKLASLPDFCCALCKNILSPPIILVGNIGNVCGLCKKKLDPSDPYILNSALENVLRQLKLPCMYSNNGCKERLDYNNIQMHKAKCAYRNCSCPLTHFNKCDWNGHSSQIVGHFEERHSSNIIRQQGDYISVDLDISKNASTTLLLLTKDEKFLLHALCDLAVNRLWYSMFYIGNPEKASDFYYNIEQKGSGNNSIKFESELVILPDSEFMCDAKLNFGLPFDLELLKQITKNTSVTSVIRILSKNAKSQFLDDRLLSYLECPVCNNFMRSPIFQCLAGHSICSGCRPKLSHCPSCRASFGATRNYALEELSHSVRFPCVHRDLGCEAVLPGLEMAQHEGECPLKPYTCPLKDVVFCHWEGNHPNLVPHLRSNHNDRVKFTNFSKTTITFSFDNIQCDIFCMVAYGQVFRVWFRHDIGEQNGYWAVQLIGAKGEAKNYKYEVGLIDIRNEHRSFIRSDLCQDVSTQFNIFNNCSVPINIITAFSYNGQMKYFCRIIKLEKGK